MKKILALLLLTLGVGLQARSAKLLGLARISNEPYAHHYLQALSQCTDGIVVLVTEPKESTLTMLKSITEQCSIVAVLTQSYLENDLPTSKNMLLQTGREFDGTHFIMLDAYQLVSAQCCENDWLKTMIKSLKPGDSLQLMNYVLWRGTTHYTTVEPLFNAFAFADDGYCFYNPSQGYLCNVPYELTGMRISINDEDHVLVDMHAQTEAHQKSVYLWTQYEIRSTTRTVNKAAGIYFAKLLRPGQLKPVDNAWLAYEFFNPTLYHAVLQDSLKGAYVAIEKRGIDLFTDIGTMDFALPGRFSEVTFWPRSGS